jgi:hypothetical protein
MHLGEVDTGQLGSLLTGQEARYKTIELEDMPGGEFFYTVCRETADEF